MADFTYTNIPAYAELHPEATMLTPAEPSVAATAASQPVSPVIAEPLESQRMTFRDVREKMEAGILDITSTKDFQQKILKMVEWQGQMDEALTKITTDITDAARTRSGLTDVERMLKESEAADRAHPLWAQYQSDSNETAHLRKQMKSAQENATFLAKEMFGKNIELNGITTRMKSFLSMQEKMLNFDMQQAITSNEREARRELINQERIDQLTAHVDPKVYDWIGKINTSIAGNVPAIQKFIASDLTGPRKKEAEQIYQSGVTEQDLLKFGALGNETALDIVTKLQAERTGRNENDIIRDLRTFTRNVQDAGIFEETIKDAKVKAAVGKDLINAYEKDALKGADKPTMAARRYEIMTRLYNTAAIRRMEGDVRNWTNTLGQSLWNKDPEIAAIVEPGLKTGQPLQPMEVGKAYIDMGESLTDKRQRLTKFLDMYKEAIDANNGYDPKKKTEAVYGIINKPEAIKRMEARLATQVRNPVFGVSSTFGWN
jgi:hypothetical protein